MAALLVESAALFANVPRAQRFPGAMRVLCRRRGQNDWIEGLTINASRSGILLRTDELLPEGTPIEMLVVFSSQVSDRLPRGVRCTGRIVRTDGTAQAATVDFYGFIFSWQVSHDAYLVSRPRQPQPADDAGSRPLGA